MTSSSSKKILFLGNGYVAQYFCKKYHTDNFHLNVTINSTRNKHFDQAKEVTIINFSEITNSILDNYNNFIISIPPFYQLETDIIIQKFHNYFLTRKTPYRLIYLSSTSVYGDHKGKKTHENSELRSASIKGLARIACEKKYLELKNNKLANIIILRLAGIYGDKRNNILVIHNKNLTEHQISERMISRIHVADIVSIIRLIIISDQIKNQIFNVSDNKPCPTYEVNNYICRELLGINKLLINNNLKRAKNSSFILDNKIIDNSHLTKALDYQLIFPSYKEGLIEILKNLNIPYQE